MSIFDIQQRSDLILKKYAQYDAPAPSAAPPSRPGSRQADDPFAEEYAALDAKAMGLLEQAAELTGESDRAVLAARNAEIRRAKQQLLTDGVEVLQKKVKKGRGVTKATVVQREQQVKFLVDRIYAIPDGVGGQRRPFRAGSFGEPAATPSAIGSITLRGPEGEKANPAYWQGTQETNAFEQEWEAAKKRQDVHLDRIEKGVGALGDMAWGMKEEVDRQAPVVDEAEKQLGAVTTQLKSNNGRMRGVMLQVRNRRTWCLEIFLICIVLSIVAYVVSVLQKKQ